MKKSAFAVVLLVAGLCATALCRWHAKAQEAGILIKTEVNLVEVYATVFDNHNRYMTGLSADQFEVRDNGVLCPINTFEPIASGFACAILLDHTGSVLETFPKVKNAIVRFIDSFRPEDWMAVYAFNQQIRKVQDFTKEKGAAKVAILHAIAGGTTALFDSVAEVLVQLSIRPGKKAVVAFTDGQDNISFLNPAALVRRAKILGIPLYFVAQREALKDPQLLKEMEEMSIATAGKTFALKDLSDADKIFKDISDSLQNSYLISYSPPPISDSKWRTISLNVKGFKNAKIKAREGYYPN
jgi:Ca-activated chloride channel homolog